MRPDVVEVMIVPDTPVWTVTVAAEYRMEWVDDPTA